MSAGGGEEEAKLRGRPGQFHSGCNGPRKGAAARDCGCFSFLLPIWSDHSSIITTSWTVAQGTWVSGLSDMQR